MATATTTGAAKTPRPPAKTPEETETDIVAAAAEVDSSNTPKPIQFHGLTLNPKKLSGARTLQLLSSIEDPEGFSPVTKALDRLLGPDQAEEVWDILDTEQLSMEASAQEIIQAVVDMCTGGALTTGEQ